MGACCSCIVGASRVKALSSSSQAGTNSKNISKGYDFSASENLFLYPSMPLTPLHEGVSVPPTPHSEGEILQSSKVKNFSFTELKAATRNFRPDSVLGVGGFGAVFKGWIDKDSLEPSRPGRGMVIAVKMLKHDGLQGHKEWLAEINYLGRLRHPNLVRLIGYCFEDEQRLLVYEFMARGSLENNLFTKGAHLLPWSSRMMIALAAAKGLAFLHNAESRVIYRDFKSANILLDSDYNAKVSDFGLARDAPCGDQTHVSTRVMGTRGYAAPEYISTGRLTTRSDVFGFGVVLLELISGRRAIDTEQLFGEHNLVDWALPYLNNKQKFGLVLDPSLRGQYSMNEAWIAATLALQCLNHEARLRPAMEAVVRALEPLQLGSKDGGGGEGEVGIEGALPRNSSGGRRGEGSSSAIGASGKINS